MNTFERWNIRIVASEKAEPRFAPPEPGQQHSPYRQEQALFGYVSRGDEAGLKAYMEAMLGDGQPFWVGRLAADDLRQAQYLAVAFVTLATRRAIEGGLSEYEAYGLSDVFVQEIDRQDSTAAVMEKSFAMVVHFTRRVARAKPELGYSPLVRRCLAYIRHNVAGKLDAATLAGHCGLSPGYLAALFKRETGVTLANCVREHRLEFARQMLLEDELPYGEIANLAGFCSQSHFIHCFKTRYGVTPQYYRNSC